MSKQPSTVEDLLSEFEFEVDGVNKEETNPGITIDMGDGEEEVKSKDKGEETSVEEESPEGEIKDSEKPNEEIEESKDEIKKEAEKASVGGDSGYKNLALKYIEKGTWSKDLAIEDEEGNEVLVSELKDLDEETFFLIDEAVKKQEEESKKDKYISIEGMEDRRKTLIEIVKEGGDLKEIFNSPEEMEDYINPFSKVDLDNEAVQERVYLNALMKHNKLDADTAQLVVEKAKKDLTLDTKVKTYVDQYTASFDKYVEGKKAEIIENKKAEEKAAKEFKKSLKEQYKNFKIKDTLASKLADSAVNKKDGEFEIDTVYAQKMENPEEAAELILFLTDKKAYLDFKMSNKSIEQHKNTRRLVKLIPKAKPVSNTKDDKPDIPSEFDFEVPAK